MTRVSQVVLVAAVTVFALSGCSLLPSSNGAAGPEPTSSASVAPSAEPTPTPTPTPVTVAKIRVGARGLAVLGSDGSKLGRVDYAADPVGAVASLTHLLGTEPTLKTIKNGLCYTDTKEASWGKGFRAVWIVGQDIAESGFWVESEAPTTDAEVSVETPLGFRVGDDITKMIAGTPGLDASTADRNTYGSRAYYDVDSNRVGGGVFTDKKSDVIVEMLAPWPEDFDC